MCLVIVSCDVRVVIKERNNNGTDIFQLGEL